MNEQPKPKNRTARVAGIVAIVAWPVGLFFGWVFAQGQDIAGAGMAQAFGIVAAAAVSLPALAVYLFARSPQRIARLAAHRAKILLAIGFVAVVLVATKFLPPIGDQTYRITVRNLDSEMITQVTVSAGADTVTFQQIEGRKVLSAAGFTNRPSQQIKLSWLDTAGESHSEAVEVVPAVPNRFDNGNLHVNLSGDRKSTAIFLMRAR